MKLVRLSMEVVTSMRSLQKQMQLQLSSAIGLHSCHDHFKAGQDNTPHGFDDLFQVMVAGGGLGDTNAVHNEANEHGSVRIQDRQDLDFSNDAKDQDRLILQLGEVVFGNLYHTRSLVLANKAHIPLSFILSSNTEQLAGGTGRDELKFSLSSTSLKQFNMVKVDANSRLPVYLHFHPVPRPDEMSQSSALTKAMVHGGRNSTESSTAVTAEGCNDVRSAEDTHRKKVWERELEIYVTCRLVKDFQRTVFLQARCRFKQLEILVNSLTGAHPRDGQSDRNGQIDGSITGGLLGGYGTSQSLLFIGREATLKSDSRVGNDLSGHHHAVGTARTASAEDAPVGMNLGSKRLQAFVLEGSGTGWQRVLVRNVDPGKDNISVAVRNPSMFFQVQCINSCDDADNSLAKYDSADSESKNISNSDGIDSSSAGSKIQSDVAMRTSYISDRYKQLRQQNQEDEVCVFTVTYGSSLVIRVRPNLALLTEKQSLWENYVEEHFLIYNWHTCHEHYRIALRFTSGNLRLSNFYLSPGFANAHPFSSLEETIARFLRRFFAFWHQVDSVHSRHSSGVSLVHHTRNNQGKSGNSRRTKRFLLDYASGQNSSIMDVAILVKWLSEQVQHHSEGSPSRSSFTDELDSPGGSSSAVQLVAQNYCALFFDFFYITDELIFYGAKGHVGHFAFNLANLVYFVVFHHSVFRSYYDHNQKHRHGRGYTHDHDSPGEVDSHRNGGANIGGDSGHTGGARRRSLFLPELLQSWCKQLGHFLTFFPATEDCQLQNLTSLYTELQSLMPKRRTMKSGKPQQDR